jgi:hypothetical protein
LRTPLASWTPTASRVQNWGVSLGGMIIPQQLPINHLDHLLTATIMSSTPDPKAIGAVATGGVTHSPLPGPRL